MAVNYKSKTQLLKELNEIKQEYSILTKVFDYINDGIAIVQDDMVKYANIKLGEFTGYPKEETINVPYIKFVHPDELPKVVEIHKRRLAGEKVPTRYESALLHRDGSKVHVEFTVTEILYKGKPAVLAIIRDITERKKLQDEIISKAIFLDNLFESGPEPVALLSPDGKVIRVNKEFTKLFGYSSDEIKGQNIDDILAKEAFYQEATQLTSRTKKGERIRVVTKRYKKDGSLVDVEIIGSPITIDGKMIAKFTIYRDISEKIKAEKEIKKREERYRAIFEGSRDAIFIADENARFVEVNQAACELTGYTKEELLKMRIPDLHEETDLHAYKRYFHRIMNGESILSEAKIIRKNRTKVDTEFSNKRIFLEGIPYMHTVARDISEWKRDKEKIKASLREKDIMLQEIHHRVKNNMQIIISLMRIQARSIKSPTFTKYLQALQERVYSMSLIHDHFYKKQEFDKINIASYIKELTNHLFYISSKKEDQIKINLDLEEILLDLNKAVPFGMLVNEIVTNVLKHAFPGRKKGELSLRLYRDGNKKIHFLVNDNGIGLPKKVNVENPSTMGFQLIRDLTQQLDGEIQIESNRGTKIKVIFPEKY
jgi:PAS domain S-box-containing protein